MFSIILKEREIKTVNVIEPLDRCSHESQGGVNKNIDVS